jgi:RimJ/RimL family protein N-acetyltransferase
MERKIFLKTDRIGFSRWSQDDIKLAELLWGNPEVTRFICASGEFNADDIVNRLNKEIANNTEYQVQYWPIFELISNELIGCCGLRPYNENEYEIGFHLRPEFWEQGYAMESANAVIHYAFTVLKAESLFAGHNPNNTASQKLLSKLRFTYIGDELYKPTGLYHPSYELNNSSFSGN